MNKGVLSFVAEKMHELMNATSCSREAGAPAQTWPSAVDTESEAIATKTYIAELRTDIMPVDGSIGFTESDTYTQVFGADKAKDVATHTMELKATRVRYCGCPAHAAAGAIPEKKDDVLK